MDRKRGACEPLCTDATGEESERGTGKNSGTPIMLVLGTQVSLYILLTKGILCYWRVREALVDV